MSSNMYSEKESHPPLKVHCPFLSVIKILLFAKNICHIIKAYFVFFLLEHLWKSVTLNLLSLPFVMFGVFCLLSKSETHVCGHVCGRMRPEASWATCVLSGLCHCPFCPLFSFHVWLTDWLLSDSLHEAHVEWQARRDSTFKPPRLNHPLSVEHAEGV